MLSPVMKYPASPSVHSPEQWLQKAAPQNILQRGRCGLGIFLLCLCKQLFGKLCHNRGSFCKIAVFCKFYRAVASSFFARYKEHHCRKHLTDFQCVMSCTTWKIFVAVSMFLAAFFHDAEHVFGKVNR